MNETLVSLREAIDDFNAGRCSSQTDVTLRIGDDETRWELDIYFPGLKYDNHGHLTYDVVLRRADIEMGEGEPPPEALWGQGPRDVDVITKVFGISLDAQVWTRKRMYTKE